MPKYNAMSEVFEEVTIFDKPALFTPIRIDRNTLPNGYHLYEVRQDDNCKGDAVQIARSIVVNHWGSLITVDEIILPSDGYLDIEPDDLNYGAGDCRSMEEFMSKYPLTQKEAVFKVIITETLKLTVEVEAKDQHEAEQIVSDNWRNSEYILDASNFVGAVFEVKPNDDSDGDDDA